jgi:hypothetical protein
MCRGYSTPYSCPAIISNIISGNSGSGIGCTGSSPHIENNIITGNSGSYAGGIYCSVSSGPYITNNTICDNLATSGGGGGIFSSESRPKPTNTILWGNSPTQIFCHASGNPSTVTVSHSDIQGGLAGIITNSNGTVNWLESNIDTDPMFVDAANGDYHLSDYSPCIGGGTLWADLDGDGILVPARIWVRMRAICLSH